MNQEYDELDRSRERRSRKNPKLQKGGKGTSSDTARRQIAATANVSTSGKKGAAKKKKDGKKRRRRIITMIVAECIALALIFGYAAYKKTFGRIQRPDFEISEIKTNDLNVETIEKMKGYWTIALFGVDSRDNTITKGTHSDVNIICNINLDTGEIKLVSVFRDSYLNISEDGSYNKINQAYFNGGAEQAIQALNRNLDLNITDYATFNWKAVAQGIDVLGGVDVELSNAEFYYINSFITETVEATGIGSHHLTHAGMNHLDGVQAVAYARLRLMDTDYARTERQRKIIKLAFDKAQKADFQTLYTLIGTVFPQVSTSLWVDDLVNNARNISKFHLGETTGFPQARGDARMGKKGSVVVPQTLATNVTKLHEFLFGVEDYVPSATVNKISEKISADTGMYKEGTYVDKVSTSGGAIPKATTAETTAAETTAAETVKATESNSEPNTQVTRPETGKPTNPAESSPVRPTDPAESSPARPTDPAESSPARPTDPAESSPARPTNPAESSPARPTEPETTAGSSTKPTRPGETTGVFVWPTQSEETSATKPTRPEELETTVTKPTAPSQSEAVSPGGPGSDSEQIVTKPTSPS